MFVIGLFHKKGSGVIHLPAHCFAKAAQCEHFEIMSGFLAFCVNADYLPFRNGIFIHFNDLYF
jgi:hypothetical protein